MTGYIMADKDRFRLTDLLPEDLPLFAHGSNRGAEFWMNDQPQNYYRRHLMIHEATHCFMTAIPDARAPIWYMEGMAELFGTHATNSEGKTRFRVMPANAEDFIGLGRIAIVNREVAAGRLLNLDQIAAFGPSDFTKTEAYAWSWALCKFLDSHPRYRDRFRGLAAYATGTQFLSALEEAFHEELPGLWTEWALFAANLELGYDVERAVIDFQEGRLLSQLGGETRIDVQTNVGWQASGVRVEAGHTYETLANGRFVLSESPKPWISEAAGGEHYLRRWASRGHVARIDP